MRRLVQGLAGATVLLGLSLSCGPSHRMRSSAPVERAHPPMPDLGDPEVLLPAPWVVPPTPTPRPTLPQTTEASILMAWGWKAFYRGDLEGALTAFEETAELAPYRQDAQLGQGRVQLQLGDEAAARAAFEAAQTIAPEAPSPTFFLAVLDYRDGAYREALSGLETGQWDVGVDPWAQERLWLRARIHLALGELDAADVLYSQALDRWPAGPPPQGVGPRRWTRLPTATLPADRYQPVGAGGGDWPGGVALFAEGGILWGTAGGALKWRISPDDDYGASDPVVSATGALAWIHHRRGFPPGLSVMTESGLIRFDALPMAPMAPAFLPNGDLLAVGRGGDGAPALYRVQIQDGTMLPYAPLPTRLRLADPLVHGARRVIAITRVDGLRLAELSPEGGALSYLTDMPHAPDPWRGPPRERSDATPASSTTASPALPSPWRRDGLGDVPAASLPSAPSRHLWSPEMGGQSPKATPTPPPRRAPLPSAPIPSTQEGDERHPSLCEDGRMVFSRMVRGTRRIWEIDTQSTQQRPLTDPQRDCWAPVCTPSGAIAYLCMAEGAPQPFIFSEAGELRLFRSGGAIMDLTWVPPVAEAHFLPNPAVQTPMPTTPMPSTPTPGEFVWPDPPVYGF